jgi:hypothetical protein
LSKATKVVSWPNGVFFNLRFRILCPSPKREEPALIEFIPKGESLISIPCSNLIVKRKEQKGD